MSVADRVAVAEIDLACVNSPRALHDALALALRFPEWYGHNWDAFRECIADPALSSMPERLTLSGFAAFAQRLPRDANILLKALQDLKALHPELDCSFTSA